MLNNLITHKLKEIVKLQDIIKLNNLSYASNHEKKYNFSKSTLPMTCIRFEKMYMKENCH